jgi:predicted transcriptional regulator
MIMDFKKAAVISNFLSKDYAEGLFKLLLAYQDISASEAASRLNMHIRTVQDFLETMADYDIIEKKEVYEKKRPYNRYSLIKKKIEIIIDLESALGEAHNTPPASRIRESKRAQVKFSTARNGEYFSSVSIWEGKGRMTKERKINLTTAQGKFLYFLPFPDAEPLDIDQIMEKADIGEINKNEILDIVSELTKLKVIEMNS